MAYTWVTKDSLGATPVLLVGYKVYVHVVEAINTTASQAYLQLFDAATTDAVTVGTTIPTYVLKSLASDPALDKLHETVFSKGIVAASTTTALGNTGATQHVRIGVK